MTQKKQKFSTSKARKAWRRWPYKNTLLLILSLIAFYYLAKTPALHSIIDKIGALGYLGAFIVGIFFVSVFTVAPAAVVLYHLADSLHPVEVALLAGLGAMIGDYIIFRFIKDRVFEELMPLMLKFRKPYLKTVFKSPYFAWFMPVVGAILIASPFPDEVGVGMLGLSKISRLQFFLITFALNAIGIFIVVTAARL